MKNFKILFIALLGISMMVSSCTDPCKDVTCNDNGVCLDEGLCECDEGYTGTDCSTSIPMIAGTEVTLTSTIQSPGLTSGAEVNIDDQFGQAAGTSTKVATIGDGVEFEDYAYNLFDIDLTTNTIEFTLVGDVANTYWGGLINTPIFAQTFLRYQFAMDKSVRISQYATTDQTINVFVDNTNNIVTVEIAEGFSFATGDTFKLTFE